jgi:hypothetical protein
MLAGQETNPFVGPRPFQHGDSATFFGREAEVRQTTSLAFAHRVVVIHSPAGAGKTSLLSAGLIPALSDDEHFDVLPVGRVRASIDHAGGGAVGNFYVSNLLASWVAAGMESARGISVLTPRSGPSHHAHASAATRPVTRLLPRETTLADALRRRSRPLGPNGFVVARVLVIDQLEELFTLYPQHWRDRADFFRQVAAALEGDELLRVVLAIGDEHLSSLEAYAPLVPGALRTRFHLQQLRPDAAYAAVTGPLRMTRRSFAPGVAEALVNDLQRSRVETATGEGVVVESEEIDAARLQQTCYEMWSNLPPEIDQISDRVCPRLAAMGSMPNHRESFPPAVRQPIG